MMTPMPPSSANDADLLRQMRSGDAAAFAGLYRRHQAPLYRFAVLRCGSAASAADIVQELFLGLLSDRFAYDPLRGPLLHFLFGVARLLILKAEAPHYRNTSLAEPDEAFEELAPASSEPLARIPAGAMGNSKAITVSDETWYVPELRITLSSRHSDPRTGVSVFRIENLKREEPEAALFVPPADYTVR